MVKSGARRGNLRRKLEIDGFVLLEKLWSFQKEELMKTISELRSNVTKEKG
jgi:tRNA nucleotidyltransferase (CCA-adding enzyme)